jgi:ArsR family transcriptional regulator, arsenate/arsenite/antimonite-responsive transcriptional repressor
MLCEQRILYFKNTRCVRVGSLRERGHACDTEKSVIMNEDEFVQVAKALADPTRRRIVAMLKKRETCTCSELCDISELSQPTVSHHLKTLEAANVIIIRREGQFNMVSLNKEQLDRFATACRS